MNKYFLSLMISLSVTNAFAEGPCGKGKYVRQCFGGCGVPYQCRYVCSGPHNLTMKPGNIVFTQAIEDDEAMSLGQEDAERENELMAQRLETLGSCH